MNLTIAVFYHFPISAVCIEGYLQIFFFERPLSVT